MVATAIMFLFGAAWLFLGIHQGQFVPGWLHIALGLSGLALATWIVTLAVRGACLHRVAPPRTDEQTVTRRQIRRRFILISGLEGAAISVAVTVFNLVQRPDAIGPTIAVIVGLHFLPLAKLFNASIYYATGFLGCAIGIAGLLISDPLLRSSFVGLSFGLLLWLTSAAVLVKASRLIRK